MAVALDDETGDYLCMSHYEQRIEVRAAVKNLADIRAEVHVEKAVPSDEDSLDNKVY